MKNKPTLLISILVALALLLGVAQASPVEASDIVINADPLPTTLDFDPATATATTCGTVDVNVRVNNVVDLTGYHLEIGYDPALLEITNVVNGGLLVDTLARPGLYEPTNWVPGDTSGTILFGMAQRGVDGDPTPVTGSGSLITITLKAKVATGSAELTIGEASMLVDWPDAFEIDFTVTGTSVVTTAGCAPTGLSLSPDSVKENELIGTTVGSFSATDGDFSETFTYIFVENETYPDNTLFTIDGSVLKTAVIFDHEEDDSRQIKVRVTDSTGLTFEKEFTISIVDINEAPLLDPIGAQTVTENETLTFTATATDPEGNPLTWSLGMSAPTGATIDPATGEFSWDATGFELGDYIFQVCVSDSVYLVCETITVTVEAAPEPLPIGIYLPLIFK